MICVNSSGRASLSPNGIRERRCMAARSRTIRVASPQALLVLVLCLMALPLSAAEPTDAVQAENAFFRGSHLLSRNNMAEAVASLEKAVKLASQNLKYK